MNVLKSLIVRLLEMAVKDTHITFLSSKMPIFKCVILFRKKKM